MRLLDAVLIDPALELGTRFNAHFTRATLRERAGDLEGALEDVLAARAISDPAGVVRIRRARLWHGLGRTEKADQAVSAQLAEARDSFTATGWKTLCEAMRDWGLPAWFDAATEG